MKDFLIQAKEDLCGEVHFLEFQEFDDETQTQIVQDEYDSANWK
jgi:hypothetical protein